MSLSCVRKEGFYYYFMHLEKGPTPTPLFNHISHMLRTIMMTWHPFPPPQALGTHVHAFGNHTHPPFDSLSHMCAWRMIFYLYTRVGALHINLLLRWFWHICSCTLDWCDP